MHRHSLFNRFTKWAARAAGHPLAFCVAVMIVVVWAATGPLFWLQRGLAARHQHGNNHHHVLMVFLI